MSVRFGDCPRCPIRLRVLALFCLLVSCVPSPEDPLDFGTLCVPAQPDCPSSRTLERDVTGRNQIDYIVRNVGSTVAVVEVLALVPSTMLDAGVTEVNPDDLVARHEHPPLAPDEVDQNRLTAQDLGVRNSFTLMARCENCDVELEWVYASVPRDCFEDDDCSADWMCDDNLGRCVECLQNSDCNEDQICNTGTGRCDPPKTTAGCSTTDGTSSSWGWMILAMLLVVGLRRRRALLLTALLVALPVVAHASPPRASIALGTGARFPTGTLAEQTRRGVGLVIAQELRWRYIGAGISLGTSYYLTTQQPPPFSRSFQTYNVSIGPRGYLPWRFFELTAGADYRRLGVANNSLVRFTGERTSFNAVGGSLGARLRWSGLELRLEGSAHYTPRLDSTILGADLAVGFIDPK